MRRTIRTRFAVSVVTTLALAAPGCGGSGKPAAQSYDPGMNPPTPPETMLEGWNVSQRGDGQCIAFDGLGGERTIECPAGVDQESGAYVEQINPGECTAVLASCESEDECPATPTPCPDPADDDDDDSGDGED